MEGVALAVEGVRGDFKFILRRLVAFGLLGLGLWSLFCLFDPSSPARSSETFAAVFFALLEKRAAKFR